MSYSKIIIALFLTGLFNLCQAQDMKIWVFIIGISEYEYFNDLNYADDDAIAFETMLRKTLGKYYNEEQTRILLNEEATSAAIESGMRWLLKNVKAHDKVYFYFSGHGGFENLTDFKLGYLHAYNAYNQSFSSGGHISLEFLQAFLQSLSVRNVQTYFIADACHAGKSEGGDAGFMFLNNSLARETQNIFKILSAQGNEKSYENSKWGGGHGAFTYYMIKGLMGFADTAPEDRLITLLEIERYLFENVPAQTQYLQNPKVVANRKDMYLAKVNQSEFELYKVLMSNEEEVNLLESLTKGDDLQLIAQLPDTARHIYALFEQAIDKNNLVIPVDSNALFYYEYIANNFKENRILASMYEKLYISIMNQSQKYLNYMLDALEKRVDYEIEDLELLLDAQRKLLQITHADDPLYKKILVRQYYIEGELNHWLYDRHEIRKKEYKLVLPKLMKAIEIDSTAAYLYYNIGALYYHTKEYNEGIKYSLIAAKLAPNWSAPYNNTGNIYNDKKQYDSAIYYYRKAIKVSPKYTIAYSNLALLYYLRTRTKPNQSDFIEEYYSATKLLFKGYEYALDDSDTLYFLGLIGSMNYELFLATKNKNYLLEAIKIYELEYSISDELKTLKSLAKYQLLYYEDDEENITPYITYARYYSAIRKYNKVIKELYRAYDLGFEDWKTFESYSEVQEFIKSEKYLDFREDIQE